MPEGFVINVVVDLLDLNLRIQRMFKFKEKNLIHIRIIQGTVMLIGAGPAPDGHQYPDIVWVLIELFCQLGC